MPSSSAVALLVDDALALAWGGDESRIVISSDLSHDRARDQDTMNHANPSARPWKQA